MKCPNCKETSRIREKDNFCRHCGFNLKEYRKSAKRWQGATLYIDKEAQGSREVVTDLNELRSKVDKQLDERVTAIIIKKQEPPKGAPALENSLVFSDIRELDAFRRLEKLKGHAHRGSNGKLQNISDYDWEQFILRNVLWDVCIDGRADLLALS